MGEMGGGAKLCVIRERCGRSYLCVQALRAAQFPGLLLVAYLPLWSPLEIQTHTHDRLFTFMCKKRTKKALVMNSTEFQCRRVSLLHNLNTAQKHYPPN